MVDFFGDFGEHKLKRISGAAVRSEEKIMRCVTDDFSHGQSNQLLSPTSETTVVQHIFNFVMAEERADQHHQQNFTQETDIRSGRFRLVTIEFMVL